MNQPLSPAGVPAGDFAGVNLISGQVLPSESLGGSIDSVCHLPGDSKKERSWRREAIGERGLD